MLDKSPLSDVARAMESKMLSEPRGPKPFSFDDNERKQIYWGRNAFEVHPTRTVIIERDGVTVERYDATFVQATVMTFLEGSMGPVDAKFQDGLMGDGLPRCYHAWLAVSGGVGTFTYLADLKVAEQFRRRGLGSWMVKQVLSRVMSQRLYLASNPGDYRMTSRDLYAFYEKHGFKRIDDSLSLMYWDRSQSTQSANKPQDIVGAACLPAGIP
jgi:GNAT superfamily N-acetyltransferase